LSILGEKPTRNVKKLSFSGGQLLGAAL